MSARPTPETDKKQWDADLGNMVVDADFARRLERQRDAAVGALNQMIETIEEPPENNCSCHISAPCNDCVDYSGLREAFSTTRAALREIEEGK